MANEMTETGLALRSFRGHFGERPPVLRQHSNFRTTRAGRLRYEKAGLALFEPDEIERYLENLGESTDGQRRAAAIREALESGTPPEAIAELGGKAEPGPEEAAQDGPTDPDPTPTPAEAKKAGRSAGVTKTERKGQGTEPLRRTKK